MKKTKVAVIGAGVMGINHVRVYSSMESTELVAVADPDSKNLEKAKKEYNAKGYSDYKKMLDEQKPEAVSICVPTKFHYEIASEVISRGINVLVEKPITTTIEQADKLISLAKEKGITFMVGHIERFNPVVTELKQRINNNELGRVYKISSFRLSPFPGRILDVGVTIDLAVHEIDIINYLTGSGIKHVFAETARRIHSAQEDLLVANIKFQNGTIGVINCNWLTPKKVRNISITGEKGMFEADYLNQELYFFENKFASEKMDYSKGHFTVIQGDSKKIEIVKKEPLLMELSSFIDSIQNNKEPVVTGEDGRHALKVAQMLLDSAKNEKLIKWE